MMNKEAEIACLNAVLKIFKDVNLFKIDKIYSNLDLDAFSKLISSYEHSGKTIFPDFYISDGFIEHFTITSSNESNKHGSEATKTISTAKRENDDIFNAYKNEIFNKPYENNSINVLNNSISLKEGSLELLRNSFIRNYSKHIDSVIKYDGIKENSIFLIELIGCSLYRNVRGVCDFYRIHKDKVLMEFAKLNKNVVRYIIFKQCDMYEFIDIEKLTNDNYYSENEKWLTGRFINSFCDAIYNL